MASPPPLNPFLGLQLIELLAVMAHYTKSDFY